MRRILISLNVPLALAYGAVIGGIAQHIAHLDGFRMPGLVPRDHAWWDGLQIPTLIVVAALVTLLPPRFAGWPLALVGDLGLWWRLDAAHDHLLDPSATGFWFMLFAGLAIGGTLVAVTSGHARPGTVARFLPITAFGAAFLIAPHLGRFGLLNVAGEPEHTWFLVTVAGATAIAAVLAFITPPVTAAPRRPWGPVAVVAIVAGLSYAVDRYVVATYTGGPDAAATRAMLLGPAWWGVGLTVACVLLTAGFALCTTGGAVARWLLVVPALGVFDALTLEAPISSTRLWEYLGGSAVVLILARYVRRWVPWEAVLLAVGTGSMISLGRYFEEGATPATENRQLVILLAFGWFFGSYLAYVSGATTSGSGLAERGARRAAGPADLLFGVAVLLVADLHLVSFNNAMAIGHLTFLEIGSVGLGLAALAAVVFGVSWWRGRRSPEPVEAPGPDPDFAGAPTQYVSADEATSSGPAADPEASSEPPAPDGEAAPAGVPAS